MPSTNAGAERLYRVRPGGDRWLSDGCQREKAEVLGAVCAIWRGEGVTRIEGVPGFVVFPVFTRADLENKR